jgi:predicted  nucleic acid-binding Zn-ribbon protein
LKGIGGGSGFRLDFLTSLSGDRQRDLVVRLVMDSLQHSISVNIRQQIAHVTDEISSSFRPLFDNLQQSQNQTQEATNQKCLSLCTSLGNKVDRCNDAIVKLEQSFQSIRKQQLVFNNDIDGIKQSIQVNETSIQGLRDTLSTQQTLLDMVQTTAQQSRQLQTAEIQGLRETINTQYNANNSVEKGFKTFHSDNDARQKDITDSVIRLQGVIDDMKRSQNRTTESMKNEIVDIIKAEVAGDLGVVLAANKLQKQRDQTVDVTLEKISNKIKALDQMFQEKLDDVATLRTELTGSNISSEEIHKTKLQQKIDDDLKIREISAKLTSLEKAVTQMKLSNNTNQSAATSATSVSTQSSLAKMEMITELQQEITVVHNTNANMKDEQEKMMQQINQLSQRIGLLTEADQTTQVTTGKIMESEARIRLELDDLRRIQILKLQTDMHERFESLASSHKKMIQNQERLRQGADALQEEIMSIRDVLSSQEKSITSVESDVVQLQETLNIQPSVKEKDTSSLAIKMKPVIKDNVDNVSRRSPGKALPPPTSPYDKKGSVNFIEKSREDDDEGSDIFVSHNDKKMKPENDDDDSSLSEKEKDSSFASSPPKSAPHSPMKQSASDVLQSQLKLQIEKEQKKAYENAVAKKAIKEVSGPPVTVLTSSSIDSNEEKKTVHSPQPIVSGSLLTSSRNRDTVNRGRVPTLTGSNKSDIPIYASALVTDTDKKDTNTINTSTRREDSIQCPHCLRRYSKTEINIHTSSCTLRTEFCKYGCGSKIRSIKMAQHYEICPKKPIDNLDNSFDSDSYEDDDDANVIIKTTSTTTIGEKKQLNDDDDD